MLLREVPGPVTESHAGGGGGGVCVSHLDEGRPL